MALNCSLQKSLNLVVVFSVVIALSCSKKEGEATTADPDESACEGGDAAVCAKVAKAAYKAMLARGTDEDDAVKQDAARTFRFATKACDLGDMDGCYLLAHSYRTGYGPPKDLKKAATLFERSCEGKNGESCYWLSMAYKKGDGVATDPVKSMDALMKACDLNDTDGCYSAGVALLGSKDKELRLLGLAVWKRGCDLGDKETCESLKREIEIQQELAEDYPGRGSRSPVAAKPVSVRFSGMEWVVEPELVGRLVVKKATCKAKYSTDYKECFVYVGLPEGWEMASSACSLYTFDGDGTKLDHFGVSHKLSGVRPGGAVKLDFNTVSGEATKAVFRATR